jgi:cell division septum initiation protein DivIVA
MSTDGDLQAENEALRAQLAELERRLAEQAAAANLAIAQAQKRVYWLDRWHIDLDVWARSPQLRGARAAARWARGLVRRVRG